MKIVSSSGDFTQQNVDALIIYKSQDSDLKNAAKSVDEALNGAISEIIETGDFTGKVEEILTLYTRGAIPAKRVIVVGLGESTNFSAETIRRAAAVGLKQARSLKAKRVAIRPAGLAAKAISASDSAQAVTEGALLGLYQYHGQKSSDVPEQLETITIVSDETAAIDTGIALGTAFAEGTILARDLINLPANVATPVYLATQAQEMANEVGLKCTVLEKSQMFALKMGALLGVAQGSENPAKIYHPRT